MYATDNMDVMAWPNWGNDNNPPCPAGWLYSGDVASGPTLNYLNFFTLRNTILKGGVFWNYVPNPDTFVCPVDRKNMALPPPSPWSQRGQKVSTYVMNGAPCYYPDPTSGGNGKYGYKTCKTTDVWSPLCYIMWEPNALTSTGAVNTGAYNDGSDYPNATEGVGRLHIKGANILALGGHTLFIRFDDFQNEANITNRNLLWWSPKTIDGRP